MADRLRLRRTFGTAAEGYDRIRPHYPERLFQDLAALAGLMPGSRVLEIGPGTGQATTVFAGRGYGVTGVELSRELAVIARRNVAQFPAARIEVANFDTWPLPRQPFDLVACFTAWHWLDPTVRAIKAADALRPGGTLAVVTTHHVAGGTEEFFVRSQECYERWDPDTEPGLRLPAADEIFPDAAEFDASGRFEKVLHHRYEVDISYSTAEYLDLLATYSGHIALEQSLRTGLMRCLAALITDEFGGRITKRYLFELAAATGRRP